MFDSRPTTCTLAAACTAALLIGAVAPAQSSKVLPGHLEKTEGNSACYFPFLYDASRSQVVWLAPVVSASTAVLNGIRFRRDATNVGYPAISLSSHVVKIGNTSVSPTTMSTTYASNITSTMTTVLNGKYSLVALPAPNPTPAPFAIRYPLKTPYIYAPSKGNLLLDWTTGTGQATRKMDYQLDAVTTAASGGRGVARQFGAWGKFAGNDTPAWKVDSTKLLPGGSADFALAGFRQGYASSLIVGLSDTTYNGVKLPLSLSVIGAPGNSLYASMDIIIPFKLSQTSTGNWISNQSYSIPKDNKLIGLSAYVQTYYADSKANGAGLVTSDAFQLTIGNTGPIAKMVGRDGASSTSGGVMRFVPVIQFVGAIK